MRGNQSGMVSIMVSMIMILVISLIVLGFAQVSRREQRQSLDRQLSSQAFFAAETAVNDARAAIATLPAGSIIPEKTTCDSDPILYNKNASMNIDSTNNVSYTCMLVSTKLKNITRELTAGGGSTNFPLEVDAPAKIAKIHLKWSSKQPVSPPLISNCKSNANGVLPVSSGWTCPYGLVRVDLVPTDSLTRADLAAGQRTYYFYPTKNGSSSTGYTPSGQVAEMRCPPNGNSCDVDITGIPAAESTFAIRVSALYQDGILDISATDAGNNPLELRNAQIQIDATGKAQDVLRRIQVRVPISSTSNTPDYALESASSICKRFEVDGNRFIIQPFAQPQDDKNPMCRPISVGP